MTITMIDSRLSGSKEIKELLKSTEAVEFKRKDKAEAYKWMQETLEKFRYLKLRKEEKGIIRKYIAKMTGYSRSQITRLITRYRSSGYIRERQYRRHTFKTIYSPIDIRLLAETDEVHDFPNGASLKKILKRMVLVYGEKGYENIANISVGHIYNLRRTIYYQRVTKRYKKTKPIMVNIGERRKPQPNGVPGYIRVDTMHQGDNGTEKGVYHINTVDEVTQFEFIGAVERISEHYLVPLLLKLIESYPFKIIEFHADNGGEYINNVVVKILNRLLITLTKSRPRHANDNALVETKNGWVLRKWLGYGFIEQKYAVEINRFYFNCFNEYLNFHRPCAYAIEKKDKKGKIKKAYPQQNYMTPYEKFKSISESNKYLKEGITFTILDKIALSKTDNQMAQIVQRERSELFDKISPVSDSQLLQAHYLI